MKFSMILAVLPVALAATGTLNARDAAREAAALAAREDACEKWAMGMVFATPASAIPNSPDAQQVVDHMVGKSAGFLY
ncbi:hypothetical protein TRIATDRAFT_304574 [Trichoderma atroviride IMI 206040]|uniref:Uncharacterized protein n=1 Tax=Hypocrea atroviridis (strain ATCC 20476 / IMI 206040) TaxID=452589 RepID=G9NIF7_HYPAI|nr:uncharacterized protein TRIATDRAFT_304574 [Trichoderma atroviride IMI 206040]EHK49569.1 hypothetical protein TRIATDRAFT_304574 [Trichoderma atroviride IMI 206040]